MSSTFHHLVPRPNPALMSIVIPCYNEEAVIPILKKELTEFLKTLPCDVEVLFVNDGSADRSLELLLAWAREDARIKVLHFARNFGHQAAVTAGLDHASGDAIVIIDADLQDPLPVIHEMLARYREGYDVAYGQRVEREGESLFKKFTAWAFYRLMRWLIHKDLPTDTGDFRLMSRACALEMCKLRESHRFLRGMVAWLGFAQVAVQYKRHARAAGTTKYPLSKMLKFAWTAALSFSPLPLRFSLGLGILVAAFGFVIGIYSVARYLVYVFINPPNFAYSPGWASLITVTCLLGGAILISVGILGEYVGRIFEEIKDRPLYIVSLKYNVSKQNQLLHVSQQETNVTLRST